MKNPVKRLIQYIKDSIIELKKVTWPTKKETTNYTLLVIGISLAIAAFIGIIDFFFSLGVEQIIK
ncbi:preprotein translocase subunit SecE [Candidatus Woesearchaeota archaeon]|nr:preprotein translocase subunit SecE [Candidatus Woesearchaeota archaeon]